MSSPFQVHADAASTLAVIALSHEPVLFLSEDLRIIASSASFSQSFGLRPADVTGKKLGELGAGEWDIPQLTSLLKATAAGLAAVEMYETHLNVPSKPPRYLVVNAHRLAEDGADPVRLLVAINDVTLARAKSLENETLIREKEILLREIQHRVANSLQIIASVLMQSARRVQSDEARGHLRDAHSRVMSIATVQHLLASSKLDDVDINVYLTQLCESLAASMIFQPERLRIVVHADGSKIAASRSISMGLIVTELVINALKHGFAEDQHGCISVTFNSSTRGWLLSVTDDGNGMPGQVAGRPVPSGLGTSIIQALAVQLSANVTVTDNAPGTRVEIAHVSDAGKAA